jgi:hypothetical protein
MLSEGDQTWQRMRMCVAEEKPSGRSATVVLLVELRAVIEQDGFARRLKRIATWGRPQGFVY